MTTNRVAACASSATVLDGVQDSRLSSGMSQILLGADGSPYNNWASVDRLAPVLSLTVVKIQQWLTFCGLAGLAISTTPFDFDFVEDDPGATRKTTGLKGSISKGIIVPTRISAGAGGAATISYDVHAGGAAAGVAPVAFTAAQTVPTLSGVDEAFRMGPVTLNAVDLGIVTDWSIDLGFRIDPVYGSNSYPLQVNIAQVDPTITVTLTDMAQLASTGFVGTDDLVTLTLLACAQSATVAGTGDIVFETNQNHAYIQGGGASHPGQGSVQLVVKPTYDGTNLPVAIFVEPEA